MIKNITVGIVIVSYGHDKDVEVLLKSIVDQLSMDDKVVVVDNKAPHTVKDSLRTYNKEPRIKIVNHDNGGFAAGCNYGAKLLASEVDMIFFINPDTRAVDGLIDDMKVMYKKFQYAAWMPLLTINSDIINSAGNIVHYSGLSWCSGYGVNIEEIKNDNPIEVKSLSGACFVIRTEWWGKVGGFNEGYFMYHEDTDLSTRITLLGGRLGCSLSSILNHDYDYEKGDYKWLYMERNRIAYILINWHIQLILLYLPALIFFDLFLLFIYLIQGRLLLKFRAYLGVIGSLKWIIKSRRSVSRTLNPIEFNKFLDWDLTSPLLGSVKDSRLVRWTLKFYYSIVTALLVVVYKEKAED